jgi:L-alanine-DL-glutamate epimerase-like enolase superfamily enzyme
MPSTDIRIARLELGELRIPFKVSFRHASAERAETSTVWVDAVTPDQRVGCGEGCPRPYVTGETIETARAFLDTHAESIRADVTSLASLVGWIASHSAAIDSNPAAWCAVELAVLHLLGLRAGTTVERLLGRPAPEGVFQYTAVLGDAEPASFHQLARRYREHGFRDFKIKLSGDVARDRAKLEIVRGWTADGLRVRADANNVWATADEAIEALAAIGFPWFAVEEPLARDDCTGLARIADALGTRVIVDESLLRRDQLARLVPPASRWLVNVRVSKMGGLLRSLDLVDDARHRGIGLIVGAQVGETSLLTRAGLAVARAAGDALVAQEGAFGTHLLSRDVCSPPLMFGPDGRLRSDEFPWLASPGWGRAFESGKLIAEP